jgi:hypothetical protein
MIITLFYLLISIDLIKILTTTLLIILVGYLFYDGKIIYWLLKLFDDRDDIFTVTMKELKKELEYSKRYSLSKTEIEERDRCSHRYK